MSESEILCPKCERILRNFHIVEKKAPYVTYKCPGCKEIITFSEPERWGTKATKSKSKQISLSKIAGGN